MSRPSPAAMRARALVPVLILALALAAAVVWAAGCAAGGDTPAGTASGLSPIGAGSVSEAGPSTDTGAGSGSGASDATTTTAPPGPTVAASGATLTYPQEWSAQPVGSTGLVVAELPGDLTAERPAGARLIMKTPGADTPDFTGALAELLPTGADPLAVAGSFTVLEEATAVAVGAEDAVSITLRDDSVTPALITRYVIVELDGGAVYEFTLEAPADQWEAKAAALEAVLQSLILPAVSQ